MSATNIAQILASRWHAFDGERSRTEVHPKYI
jgi:hypothetical protein